MSKYQITKGKQHRPLFGVLYGVEGIGKTTFGSKLPNPVFIGPETSAGFNDVSRYPKPKDWNDFINQLQDLAGQDFKSVIIDSLDWLENMLFEQMKTNDKVKAVEDCAGGFGKWVGLAQRHWLNALTLIEHLVQDKKMNVLMLAHYQVKAFNDPLTAQPYDRYQMKLNEKCAAIIREAVDFVFFANFKAYSITNEKNAKKGKGVSDGARVVYTEKRASHDAKNRFGLPPEIDFDFAEIMKLISAPDEDKLKSLQKDIEDLLMDMAAHEKYQVMIDYYAKVKNDYHSLIALKNRLKIIINQGE